jgi:arylformamidase
MLNPIELDRQYNARALVPDHAAFFARWRADSVRSRKALNADIDMAYGRSGDEKLDLFHAERRGAPLLVFVHGGYWRSLDKSDFSFLAPAFVARDVNLAVVNYGLAPATSMEEMVRQLLRAVSWLYKSASSMGVDPQRIVIAGHSAGAHLAAMMAAADWSKWDVSLAANVVHGIVCISGLYDLEPLARAPFLKDDIGLDRFSARKLSPANYRPRLPVPLLTAVGGDESAEFHRQNMLIRSSWPHCFRSDVALPGRNHFSVVDALVDPDHLLFHSTLGLLDADTVAEKRRPLHQLSTL